MPELQAFAPRGSTLEISVGPCARGEVVIVARGELDCDTAGELRSAITVLLNRGGVHTIGLDLRGVDLIDSNGLGTLVAAQRICQGLGVRLRLVAIGPSAARVLGVTPLRKAPLNDAPALAG